MNTPIKLTAAQRMDVLDELRLTYGHSGDVEGLLNDVLAALRDFATPPSAATEPSDAERYQLVRRGQHWSVIDGVGDVLRGDDLDAAVDSILAARLTKDTP